MSIRTLLPMAVDGVGPSHTCARLADGIAQAGYDIEIMVNRQRGEPCTARVLSIMPGLLAYLPHRPLSGTAARQLEAWYLRRLGHTDVDTTTAWLWPNVSLRTHAEIARRGIPIVLEGINTRMAHAKPILDAAYDAFGAIPGHGITHARIAEEDEKLAMAGAIFAPSPTVEDALIGSPLTGRILSSSYGTDLAAIPYVCRQTPKSGNQVTFLFVGYACIRKGIQYLLDLWPKLPSGARLKIVGKIEPVIADRYSDLLASDRVDTVGFTRNVRPHYETADVFVFPSLEEGDPLVGYEAAAYGLPIVASRPGAGRMGGHGGGTTLIDPRTDTDQLEEALVALYRSPELRQTRGAAAKVAVGAYDWLQVGARRAPMFANLGPTAERAPQGSTERNTW